MDSITYVRTKVFRGAKGLLTATGKRSITINFVRKRPSSDFQAKIHITVDSWERRHIYADISGPLNEAGNVGGRLVMAYQQFNSCLNHYRQERNLVYGIIEADITDNTAVAFGHTQQQNNSNTPTWGRAILAICGWFQATLQPLHHAGTGLELLEHPQQHQLC